VEVGAGLGSLTVALAQAGCEVVAIELDRALTPALAEATEPFGDAIHVVVQDAMRADWSALLPGRGWAMVSNLPYNVSVPLLLDLLQTVPAIDRYVVMVQREVGERLVSGPGEQAYGAVSLRVAYRADARLVRRVGTEVFWPRPKVDSVLVRIVPRLPPVQVDRAALFVIVDEAFAQRRKTVANALRRLGLEREVSIRVLAASGLDPRIRAEQLGLVEFARVAEAALAEGWRP
jgi:16S rRNA (adenine1518-N6/adenine1519-N6)-dimethyltransferase